MTAIINASSRFAHAAAGCVMVVCSVGAASFVPGLLSRVVSHLAFHPPSPPGYHVTPERRVLLVTPGCELVPLPDLTCQGLQVDVVRMWTRRRNTVYGFHFRHADQERLPGTILFSHGNSTDIGLMFNFLAQLAVDLGIDVFTYDYSGYGESSGVPSEADLCADIDAAYHYLVHDIGLPCHLIYVLGQSIGSVPSTDLASRKEIGGLVLQSALKSGLGMIHDVQSTYWFDVFKNIEKVKQVHAPVFVIHGTDDAEVPLKHGTELFEAVPPEWAHEPWWVTWGGHNDIEINHREEYITRLYSFIQACQSTARRWQSRDDDDDIGSCKSDTLPSGRLGC